MSDIIEITNEQATQLDDIETKLMDRLTINLRQMEFEDFYQYTAEQFGTNDPDVKWLLQLLQDYGLLDEGLITED